MRFFFVLAIFHASLAAHSQSKKFLSLQPEVHFNIVTGGLGANDAGGGAGLQAFFFATHKLQLAVEGQYDRFFGDRVLYTDENGKPLKSPSAYNLTTGPRYFITKNIALSATGGPAWHRINETVFSAAFGLRLGVTGFVDKQKRLLLKAAFTSISVPEVPVRYISTGFGYRI